MSNEEFIEALFQVHKELNSVLDEVGFKEGFQTAYLTMKTLAIALSNARVELIKKWEIK